MTGLGDFENLMEDIAALLERIAVSLEALVQAAEEAKPE